MRTKLRKTLYIGLGGTGMSAILRTKKMFVDNYDGHVPPMIGFLGIDTDGAAYTKNVLAKDGTKVILDPYEQCSISVRSPRDYFDSNKRRLSWMPEENVPMIKSLDKGAGQVRTNGRLALINNMKNVKTAIENVYGRIGNNNIVDNPLYELAPGNTVDVHIVFSVSGGTGCGTFIDLAYFLKSLYTKGTREINIFGYGVLPNVFHEMNRNGNAMANTRPNALGAIQDLDYLMHIDRTGQKINFDWLISEYEAKDGPFDIFYFIDNKNDNNIIYNHVDSLSEMISLALVSSVGSVGDDATSGNDNILLQQNDGQYNVEDKKSWASCIGASQIVFRGDELAKVYSLLVKQRLIQRMLNSCSSGDQEADRWIDSSEVKIRENNNHDDVIDELCKISIKDFQIDKKEALTPEPIVEEFTTRQLESVNKSAAKKLQEKLANVEAELKKEVQGLLQTGDCGVTLANDTLLSITRQINLFLGEMTSEKEELELKIPGLEGKRKAAIEELKRYADKFLKLSGRLEDRINDVVATTKSLLKTQMEILRRTYAIQFYNDLLSRVEAEYRRVSNIKSFMTVQSEAISAELSKRRNQSGTFNSVEVNLAEESWDLINISDKSLAFPDFFKCLPAQSLYELSDSNELAKALDEYSMQLPEYHKWENMTVDDILEAKTDEQFEQIVQRALDKAMPFMKLNGKGKITAQRKEIEQTIDRYYFICLPDKNNSRLTRDNYIDRINGSTRRAQPISTGLKDRIIIYRQESFFPAYAINGIDSYAEDVHSSLDFHFDAIIEQKMKDEHYQLMPKDSSEIALAFWVNGFIFGLIKYDETKRTYFFYDEVHGKARDKFWYNTGEHYRDQAFNFFDKNLKSIQERWEEIFEEKIRAMGETAYKALVADVKENYEAKYSQVPVQFKANTRNQTPVAELLERELTYVLKELGK